MSRSSAREHGPPIALNTRQHRRRRSTSRSRTSSSGGSRVQLEIHPESTSSSRHRERGTNRESNTRWALSDDMAPINVDPENVLEQALQEMIICRKVFDDWGNGLDKINSTRPSPLEIALRDTIHGLREDATQSLTATKSIINSHKEFSRIMARCMLMTAERPSSTVKLQPGVIRLATDLRTRSEALTIHTLDMKGRLMKLIDTLEEAEKQKNARTGWWEPIGKWLLQAFEIISKILATVAVGMDGGWMKMFMAVLSYTQTGSKQDFDEVLRTLKEDFPLDVAKVRMGVFEACHNLFQVEMEIQRGKVVKMNSDEALAASVAWQTRSAELELIPVPDVD